VATGVVTHVNDKSTVCASGAVPPADGKLAEHQMQTLLQCQRLIQLAMVCLVRWLRQSTMLHTMMMLLPQSASMETANVPCVSVVKYALPSKVW
jgi:hypothetical protein